MFVLIRTSLHWKTMVALIGIGAHHKNNKCIVSCYGWATVHEGHGKMH